MDQRPQTGQRRRHRDVLTVALAVAAMVGADGDAGRTYASAASAAPPAVSISLDPLPGEHVRGGATLAAIGAGTSVELTLARLPIGAQAVVRLHVGHCAHLDRLSASSALLATLKADASGRANAATRVTFHGQDDVQLAALTDGHHVIIVALDNGVVACGLIPFRESRRVAVGTAIGAIAIGMRRSDVLAAYGKPRSETPLTFPS